MKCYLCGSTDSEVVAKKEDIRFGCFASDKNIVKCRSCGLVQLSPPWTSEELDQLYLNYWGKKDFPGQKRKVKISKYLTNYIYPGDQVLEIGCGHGDNVKYLRSKGINAVGIDKDKSVCDGITKFNWDWKDYNLIDKTDVIYAIHLLEHLPDPKVFIKWIRKNSRDFIIEIPCIDDVLMRLPSFRKFCWYPYHLFFYSKKTARILFGPKVRIFYRQEYGIINHLRWFFLGRPGNYNRNIPILDRIYKTILTRLGFGDTLVICST